LWVGDGRVLIRYRLEGYIILLARDERSDIDLADPGLVLTERLAAGGRVEMLNTITRHPDGLGGAHLVRTRHDEAFVQIIGIMLCHWPGPIPVAHLAPLPGPADEARPGQGNGSRTIALKWCGRSPAGASHG